MTLTKNDSKAIITEEFISKVEANPDGSFFTCYIPDGNKTYQVYENRISPVCKTYD
jgi:hypothetical protein